ncbi:MAG TPA: IS1595 family transposase [Candidatus Saccharimonadales bacterium]|jgi:transposase-like protein|nr:IS1595 family transposase [Candidatus Saccharimonadales bacterium]
MKTYSFQQFLKEYPNDEICLDKIFNNYYGELEACPGCGVIGSKFYRLKGRKAYSCEFCRFQIHPLSGTIFHKSDTPLTKWLYAIYLFSVSKNGVSALELQRHLQVTYKTAWRIGKKIRGLMTQNKDKLSGIIEIDETYIGGKQSRKFGSGFDNKTSVIGMTERNGLAKVKVDHANSTATKFFLEEYASVGSEIYTDESPIYTHVKKHFTHKAVNHSLKQYVMGEVHTNSIEGFWGQLKRSIDGTYHAVSSKYLQSYLDQFVFLYNHRQERIYPILFEKASKRV